ncbi:uncharacterized protein HMPREF1541_04500 [Cyphellophora europaea CBS 101466]|uniref:Uncharacterized protein n=1 Tax=Cyphellophora europaea (strain CBS 101466) TaxID=1220924 RepID=W2RX01_CYPE1|nr:uncharacterized protein HMPREF1541_04500 [Cyphellophora europaea CBS 101466]ETN40224.1 hypothetical protein HMPREF1541_04500 [Cyphellophora europaea CBS 101466]
MLTRRLMPRSLLCIAAILLLTGCAKLLGDPPLPAALVDRIIYAATQTGLPLREGLNPSLPIQRSLISTYYHSYRPPSDRTATSIRHLRPLLRCRLQPNPETGHIRVHSPHLDISLTPPEAEPHPSVRHFNPTIIPLPSYAASFTAARYLLVTRLVTPGLHQESHACLATFCLPQPASTPSRTPPDAVPCTPSDVKVLGGRGGLRCLTEPRRLNVPPTPAKRCTGEWASFADIPGFHDPRIMWSGRGEPLIVVNSASTYGCVGLWIMDLRVLVPELRDVMERRTPEVDGGLDGGVSTVKRDVSKISRQVAGGRKYQAPVLRYETLTELTRWGERNEVEKNWILWFPGHDGETWMSYEGFGKWELNRTNSPDGSKAEGESTPGQEIHTNREGMPRHHPFLPDTMPWPMFNLSNFTSKTSSKLTVQAPTHNSRLVSATGSHAANLNTVSQDSISIVSAQPIRRSFPPSVPSRNNTDAHRQGWTYHGGRTVAQLLSHGYTTPNLTSPDESPCLQTADFLDPTGKPGHFHQSSPALKLILCHRRGSTDGSIHLNATGSAGDDSCPGSPRDWTRDGRAVHFGVVHRKFSNAVGMPERYERWAVVCEGMYPFRVLAVGKHPLAFAGEVVRPWGREENGLLSETEDVEKGQGGSMFTYTTSVAWAWRPGSVVDAAAGEEGDDAEHLSALGTGFLGDDVIVGVGVDDVEQAVVRLKVEELLSCLRLCPGVKT